MWSWVSVCGWEDRRCKGFNPTSRLCFSWIREPWSGLGWKDPYISSGPSFLPWAGTSSAFPLGKKALECWLPLFHCLLLVYWKAEVVSAVEALSMRKLKGLLPGLVWGLPILDGKSCGTVLEKLPVAHTASKSSSPGFGVAALVPSVGFMSCSWTEKWKNQCWIGK